MMINYSDYFTSKAIIEMIVNIRSEEAFKRHDEYFLEDIEINHSRLHEVYKYCPPRRLWVKPNRQLRMSMKVKDQAIWSLTKTIYKYKYWESNDTWASNLRELIQEIQIRAFQTQQIDKPSISFLPKDDVYSRPLALYDFISHLFISLTNKYLTDFTDPIFSTSSIAFRSKEFQKKTGIYNYHQIIQKIIDWKKEQTSKGKNVYVSECDIKSFYDTVSHSNIKYCLDDFEFYDRAYKMGIDVNIDIFNLSLYAKNAVLNYLNSYEFKDVLDKAQQLNKKIKYPQEDIEKLWGENYTERLGIPQGGAISCWLSNLILNDVDKSINTGIKYHKKVCESSNLYYRYCDDMIMLSTSKRASSRLCTYYIKQLKNLNLPYHKSINVPYSKEWYSVKTKKNYKWGESYPYISFLGYQIKHDGTIRIRQKSIDKERDQQSEFIDDIINKTRGKDINPQELLAKINSRWYKRITGLSFTNPNKAKNFAWSDGFKLLSCNEFDKTQIKDLDRSWNRQLKRLRRELKVKRIKSNKKFHYKGSYYSSYER